MAPTGERCGIPEQADGRAGEYQQHLDGGGQAKDHFDGEQRAFRDGIDQQLAEVERGSHGGEQHRDHLPIEKAEQQSGREDFVEGFQLAGLESRNPASTPYTRRLRTRRR